MLASMSSDNGIEREFRKNECRWDTKQIDISHKYIFMVFGLKCKIARAKWHISDWGEWLC